METDHSLPSATNQLINTPNRKPERIWVTTNPMPTSVEHSLISACGGTPAELCGFIDSDWLIHYVDNVHDEPTHNFLMDKTEYVEVLRTIVAQGKAPLGIFHTHPNNVPWPTPRDLVGWPPVELGWRYWIVNAGRVIEWGLG